jgi:hypothetical protein
VTWFRVDDGFWGHEKVTSLSDSALALWVQAGSWTARYRKDGSLPRDICKRLGRKTKAISELVECGLWVETTDGYAFHDFDQWQKHIATQDESKEQAAERQRKARMSRVTPNQRHEKAEETVTRDLVLPLLSDPILPVPSDARVRANGAGEPDQERPPPEPEPPNPSRFKFELEELVRGEFFERNVTPQKAPASQWRDGCQTVADALQLGAYPDARAAMRAFARALVDACAAGKPLGLALQQTPLGEQLKPVAPRRQLSELAMRRLAEGT